MKKHLLRTLFVALMVMIGANAWAGDKTVVKYSFDDAMNPSLTAGNRVSLDYGKTSVITSTTFLNAWNNTNGDPAATTVSLSDIDISGETWTLSFEWAACGGCNSKADHTTLKAGDTNLFDLTGNSNWNTTVTITYAGSDGTKTLPVPGCDKGKRFTAGTGDQLNTTAYWHHIVVTGSASGVTMTITNSSTGTAVVENVTLSETNVNPTSLIIEPCCGGAIGIDELSLTYYVEGEVIQTPTANYTAVDGINRTITATCDTEGATLYYSLDNENWTEGASVTVSASGNVYFKAVKGSSESDVLTFAAEAGTEIVLNTPAIVRNANGIVTISADQSKLLLSPETTIYYTYGEENGSFTGSKELTVAADATITAYAEAEGYATSLTATRAVALFPEQVDTLFSAAAATKGWSANAFSNETITASERTYATLLLDEAAWSENVLFQTDGAWGLRASGNWYINSNTDNSWLLVKDGKAGNIVIVDATFAPAETVNATYAEKYSFGTKHAYTINADGNAELALIKPSANEMDYFYGVYGYSLTTQDDPATDALAAAKEALQTAIAIATNINPEGLADAITAAQAALNAENATVESIAQAAQTLEAAIKAYFGEVLPRLGAIVQALNDSTLNAAYANAQATLAKEGVTPQELAAAMQQIITTAQQVAPAHLQNLRVYAAKYGTTDAVTIVDNALAAITSGNVSQIIATMAAVNEAATPIAQQVLGGIISYVRAFGLTEQAAQAQAALESGNYITMITVAKALYTHLIAAAKDYLPKLAVIAEGLNDSTLNAAYAEAQALFVNEEDITPEDLGAAMQKIIVAAKEVAPAHLQNLRGYALKYGQEGTAALVDSALVAINEGNVSKIIATMTAVKEAATPLATNILQQIIGYAQSYAGFEEDVTAAQAALRGGNYITMITTAKALYAKLIAAANAYVASVKEIPTEGKEGVDDLNAAILAAEQALEAQDADFSKINTAISNLVAAVAAFKAANQPQFDPATVIVNAEFNPEADPLGWEKVNSAQFYDLGMGLIGTYQVRGEHSASTVDETHLATEFAAGLECRWNTNYAAFTQTTAELPAGSYKLSFDVENTNATTTQANYENRFFVKVGETTYNDESTEWMNGKSAWTTHTITFTLTEASPITISLGYGTGSNNFGVGNTPALFVSHLMLDTCDPLVEAKAKAIAALETLAPIGEGLFFYNQTDIDNAKNAINAAETVEAVAAVAMPKANAPAADKAYAFQLRLDGETPLYMALAEGGITIAEEATALKFIAVEGTEGQYNLSNEDGTLFVGLAGGNAWTMSTLPDKMAAWTFTALPDGAYRINNLVTTGRFVGTNSAEKTAGSACYADKQTSNGNVDWLIAEYVAPVKTDYTDYIVNADLKGEGGFDATGTKGIDGSGIVKVGNAAEFDFKQTISIPSGYYRLTAQAAYRYGGDEAAEAAAITEGTATKLVKMYVKIGEKEFSVPVQNRYDGASETNLASEGAVLVNDKYVPNSSSAVQAWFAAGKYVNEVIFNLPADGDVTIGINRIATPESDYTVIGPWTLTRLGDAEAEPEPEPTPEPIEGIIYSWESPEGTPVEFGGTIAYVNGDGDRLNYKNGDYYTICLNGKKANIDDETASANAGKMVITLDEALNSGDTIVYTAYINKNTSATAAAYILFENGAEANGADFSDAANINEAFGGTPQNDTIIVSEAAAGSKTITLTRGKTGTNLFITKFQIIEKKAEPEPEPTPEPGTDMTAKIVNPSFEDGTTGWTYEPSNDHGAKENSNGTYTMTGCDGNYIFNIWSSGNAISQKVEGLPNGTYKLKAVIATDGGHKVQLNANGKSVQIDAVDKGTGVEGELEFNVLDGTATIGAEGVDKYWYKVDNFRLYFIKGFDIDELVTAYETALADAKTVEGNMNAEVKTALEAAIAAEVDKTNAEALGTTTATLVNATADAKASVAAYANAATILPKMKELTESTNVYTAEAYEQYYNQWVVKYEAATLTTAEANALQNPFLVTGWRASITCDNFLLSAWDTNPDFQDAPYYINSWSVEGENDGSNFKVPFFEYWTGDGDSLGEKVLTATMNGLEAGDYDVTAWVRVRMKNGAEAPAFGITLQVNEGEAVDVAAGDQVGTSQFYIKEFTATGTVAEDGVLKIKFNVAADNNISWLSFKNVKYAFNETATGIHNINAEKTAGKGIYNLSGQKVTKAQKGLFIINGKKVVK